MFITVILAFVLVIGCSNDKTEISNIDDKAVESAMNEKNDLTDTSDKLDKITKEEKTEFYYTEGVMTKTAYPQRFRNDVVVRVDYSGQIIRAILRDKNEVLVEIPFDSYEESQRRSGVDDQKVYTRLFSADGKGIATIDDQEAYISFIFRPSDDDTDSSVKIGEWYYASLQLYNTSE